MKCQCIASSTKKQCNNIAKKDSMFCYLHQKCSNPFVNLSDKNTRKVLAVFSDSSNKNTSDNDDKYDEINIEGKPDVSETSFSGLLLNSYVAHSYFLRKYPHACAVIYPLIRQDDGSLRLDWDFSIQWTCDFIRHGDNKTLCKRKLVIPKDFKKNFNTCIRNPSIRFIFGDISLKYNDDSEKGSAHANIFLYDKKDNSVEIFDPWGMREYEGKTYFSSDEFNTAITNYFKDEHGVKEVYTDYCPAVSFQLLEDPKDRKETDPGGFCEAWSMWWIDYRLANSLNPILANYTRKQLANSAIRHLKQNPGGFKKFIRNYAEFIVQEKAKMLEGITNLPDMLENDKKNNKLRNQIHKLMKEGKVNEAEKLSSELQKNSDYFDVMVSLASKLILDIYCQHPDNNDHLDEIMKIAEYRRIKNRESMSKKELCNSIQL